MQCTCAVEDMKAFLPEVPELRALNLGYENYNTSIQFCSSCNRAQDTSIRRHVSPYLYRILLEAVEES